MAGVAEPQCTPIFGIDLWEHAYFTQYHGNKENYSSAFFDELDWNKLSYNFEEFNLKGQMAPLFWLYVQLKLNFFSILQLLI